MTVYFDKNTMDSHGVCAAYKVWSPHVACFKEGMLRVNEVPNEKHVQGIAHGATDRISHGFQYFELCRQQQQ